MRHSVRRRIFNFIGLSRILPTTLFVLLAQGAVAKKKHV
jgi:hypothetical protein